MDLLLPMSFWGGWTAGIVVIGLFGWAWLSWGMYRARDARAPDHTWDETLREGNDTPPKWWFFALFTVLIFSVVYLMLYPGLGNNKGYLEWNQYKQLADGLEYYKQRTQKTRQYWETAPLAELQKDDEAMQTARRLYAINCAACHGEDASGQAGVFPSLADDEWHWGGSDAQILDSITKGRVAVMPGWEAALSDGQIDDVANYVLALSEGDANGEHPGHATYQQNCVACHGTNGEGNPALGAPRFVSHHWQYVQNGDILAGIKQTIRQGRNGIMPAQQGRLTDAQIRLLAAWLGGGRAAELAKK